MTDTSFGINDPRTQKKWAVDMFNDAIATHRLGAMMGTTQDDVIRVNQDLTRAAGGSVLFESWDELSGAGVGDDGDTTNNAQQLTAKNQSVYVHEHATRAQSAGDYSLQLTSLKGTTAFRAKAKEKLSNWIREVLEKAVLASLTGEYNENYFSSAIETINEVYPNAARALYLGQSLGTSAELGNSGVSYGTDALLTAGTRTSNLFGTLVIDKARADALTATPRIRPCKIVKQNARAEMSTQYPVQGSIIGNMFVILASPAQMAHLRSDIGAAAWAAAQQGAAARGNDNAIFTGASILWNGCIVHEWERIPSRTGAGGTTLAEGFLLNAGRTATTDACASGRIVHRALFLGANAGLMAWAKPFSWFEDYYDGKPFVKSNGLYGCKVNQWCAHGGSSAGNETSRMVIDTEV